MNQPFSLFLSRVVASLLVMLLALAAAGAFLIWVAASVDKEDIRRQKEIAGYALGEILPNLAHNQESSTYWDEAVGKTAQVNEEWIDENLGTWMHTFFGIDEVYVLNGQDQPIYAFADEQINPPGYVDSRLPLFMSHVATLRAKLAAGEEPREGSLEQSVGVADYVYVEGRPAALSLKPILSDSGRLEQPASTIHVHVAIQYLDGNIISKVGQAHVLEDLKFVPAAERDPDAPFVALTSATGGATVEFEWNAFRPGRRLMTSLSPILALVASTLLVGTLIISSASYRRKLDQIRTNERIRYLATHDGLTGLLNRAAHEAAADELLYQLSRRQQFGPLVFLYMDIDRLKQVNDILGHHVGDAVLIEFARRVTEILPPNTPLYRVGGDEFAVLLPNRTQREIEILCNQLIESIAEPMDVEGRRAFVGVSIGVSVAPHHGTDRQELHRKVDVALYHAKLAGRRRFSIFGSQMDDAIQNRAAIESDLREALKTKDGLSVVYQPKFACGGGRVLGAEALVRWTHPKRGPISPAAFIPIAEEANLISNLGLWVLETACREAVGWPVDHLAVNVSPVQLRAPDFAETVSAVLAKVGFPPARLELEMTETDFVGSEDVGLQNIRSLHAMGIAIAIDDFGTGSSTFERLREISFDRIKIDRSFVKNIAESVGDAEIVRAMISMAHAKGLKTTAEGVETQEQRDVLCALGCDELQGFLLGKPMPSAQLSDVLTTTVAL